LGALQFVCQVGVELSLQSVVSVKSLNVRAEFFLAHCLKNGFAENLGLLARNFLIHLFKVELYKL